MLKKFTKENLKITNIMPFGMQALKQQKNVLSQRCGRKKVYKKREEVKL